MKDESGKKFRTTTDNPDFMSGKLKHINRGRHLSEEQKLKQSDSMKQLKWFNDGTICVRRKIHPEEGWCPGRLQK